MTTAQFQEFVRAAEVWFCGRFPQSEESLREVERNLGVSLPTSLRWLLKEYGYWHGTGVSNLESSVTETQLAREHLGLPHQFIVLENHHDGGIILIDTGEQTSPGENPVYGWIGAEDLGPEPNLPASARFASFGAYVAYRLPTEQEFIEPRWVRYDPADYPEGSQAAEGN
jgi:hypothetical protein